MVFSSMVLVIFFFWLFLLIFFVLGIVLQPQGDHIELHQKRHGRRPDYEEQKRKREAREVKKRSQQARKVCRGCHPLLGSFASLSLHLPFVKCFVLGSCNWWSRLCLFDFVAAQLLGAKGKRFTKKRYDEKAQMKKT
jgi:ribosome biogenesis protein NSA2